MKMKKMTAFLLGALMCMQGMGISAFADGDRLFGDLDGNGRIDASDVACLLSHCATIGEGFTLTEEQKKVADIDRNGTINSEDGMYLLEYCAMVGSGRMDGGNIEGDLATLAGRNKVTERSVSLIADSASFTPQQLSKNEYTVPILIHAETSWIPEENNFNPYAIELGIKVDDRCTYQLLSYDDAIKYGSRLDCSFFNGKNGNLTWCCTVSNREFLNEKPNLALLLVTVPSDAEAGDSYNIEFTAPEGKQIFWTVADESNLYQTDITCSNGSIAVIPDVDGDINADNVLSVVDIVEAYKRFHSGKALPKNCDMNKDGNANIIDVALMKQAILEA